MSKQNGLGARFLVGGYDLSGDINALDSISGMQGLIDDTDITQSAHSRMPGLRDGSMGFAAYMDPANAHPVLSALPVTDVLMSFLMPPLLLGSTAAYLNAKQVNYDPTRANDGALLIKVEGQGNEWGLEWGAQLTAGPRTDTAATNGASLDQGGGFTTPAVPASGTPAVNTSPLPATVVVTGGTVSNVVVNGVSVGSGDGTYAVPSGQPVTLTYSAAPTWTWTLGTAFGAQAYLQLTGFTGTNVTVTVQQAPDNATWATLAAFTAATAAPYTQRVPVAGAVARYLRVITAGTFSSATFAVMVNVNQAATGF
jgi:hypothetical protein